MAQNSLVSVMWKGSKLLSRQAQPEECALARSARTGAGAGAGAIPSMGGLLAPEAAPGRHSPWDRPRSFSLATSPAQPKRAVPV